MKRLILILLILCSFEAAAQVVTAVSSSYDVPGTYSAYIQDPDYYPEAGNVVIKVRVLKDGSMYDAVVDEGRSTVKNSSQQRSARSAVLDSYFLVSDSAQADTLSGTVTYVFTELSPKQLDSLRTEYLSSIDKSLRILRNQSSHELFPTDNIWTFLQLDTRTGLIYQLQFTVKDDPDYRGKV